MSRFYLCHADWQTIRAHINAHPDQEVCGLIGGVWRPFPKIAYGYSVCLIPNIAPQRTVRYQMQPHAQLKAMLGFERQGWQTVGIYHSHPQGEAKPSPTDIAEAAYPDAVYLIGVPQGDLNGWRIVRGAVFGVEMLTMPTP